MQVSLNTRINHELAAQLDKYSKDTETSKAQIVAKALEEYFKKEDGCDVSPIKPDAMEKK